MYSYVCFSSDGRLYCSVLYVKIVRLHFTSFAMLPSWHNNRIFQVSLTFNVLTWSMRAFFASNRCHHVKFSFWVQYNKASFSTNCNVYLNGCLHRYSALANSHMSAYSIMQHSPGYYTSQNSKRHTTTCALARHRSECEFYLEHFVVQQYLYVFCILCIYILVYFLFM